MKLSRFESTLLNQIQLQQKSMTLNAADFHISFIPFSKKNDNISSCEINGKRLEMQMQFKDDALQIADGQCYNFSIENCSGNDVFLTVIEFCSSFAIRVRYPPEGGTGSVLKSGKKIFLTGET